MTLEQLFAGHPVDWNQVMARLKQAAQEAGLPFSDRTMTYNTRKAQELAKWAESKGLGDNYNQAVFRAYFVDGMNIGKIEELTELIKVLGLSGEEARDVLMKNVYKEAVDKDWLRSRHLGIQAVPTFVLNRTTLVGAQPYHKLVAFVEAGKVRKRQSADQAG